MINFFRKKDYRNKILCKQNQMSSGLPIIIGMVKIAPDNYRDGRINIKH